ncbi:hypothetical protein [Desulfuribacillus alkaliarsenatis]|uniref:DUF2325 domain-containing protein n=1 Tax=Desulfuribacillus alkaliarsenatis TaxID=766136 RepID=A0A1E5FZN1_9FIRM|nr:hypothetical protein [Desulfuribacillus alkaliarsenatis]OEF95952.1 hypothetical protein BHF68_11220 [Desulfuribacillus alkaliarsenatis]
MNEIVKDILEFYEVTPSAYLNCSACGNVKEAKLQKAPEKLPKSTMPWVLFYKDLYILPSFDCCDKKQYPTHIRLKADGHGKINPLIDEMLFSEEQLYKIGTIKVPVISDELLSYPITRSYEEQIVIQKQLAQQTRLLARKQEEFYKHCYSYFSIHFDEIIQEMDGEEILDVLDAVMNTSYGIHLKSLKAPVKVNKKDKKTYLNWVKKQIRQIAEKHDDQGKQMIFYLIVKYFVEWELIQGIYYLRWNVGKYQKMIGKTLLLYMVMQFPLTKHFSYLREEALYKLIPKKKTTQKRHEVMNIVQNDLKKANQKIEKMQQTIERQRETILLLESKLETIESKNSQLNKELQLKEEQPNLITQTKKIKGLKGIIESLRYELQTLRDEVQDKKEDGQVTTASERKLQKDSTSCHHSSHYSGLKEVKGLDATVLDDKTVGIFGDVQIQTEQIEPYKCTVLNANSAQTVEGISVMNKSDVLVVLTQHISHACMWAIKDYASDNRIPVIFSRHTNTMIILDQVSQTLVKEKAEEND